jgi:hypothetical protein
MKTGILGSGPVGQVLAKAFLNEGYEVMLGTRNIEKPEVVKFKSDNPGIETGNFEQTVKYGELLVLATGGSVTEEVIKLSGASNFSGKIVIDTTNPIAKEPPVNGVLKFFTTLEDMPLLALLGPVRCLSLGPSRVPRRVTAAGSSSNRRAWSSGVMPSRTPRIWSLVRQRSNRSWWSGGR